MAAVDYNDEKGILANILLHFSRVTVKITFIKESFCRGHFSSPSAVQILAMSFPSSILYCNFLYSIEQIMRKGF